MDARRVGAGAGAGLGRGRGGRALARARVCPRRLLSPDSRDLAASPRRAVSAFAQEKRRKGCHNYHDQCEPWALQGECTRVRGLCRVRGAARSPLNPRPQNSGYMVGSDGSQGECRKACGACK